MEQPIEIDKLKYKSKLIDVFKAFIAICEEHKLQYYCIGGTLIGAIRHQGMIPWDDDIDVIMPRPDYDKLIHLKFSASSSFELIAMENNTQYYLPYAKFCDKESSLLEYTNIPSVLGLFVDVFPLDGAHDDEKLRTQDLLAYKRLANKLHIQPKLPKDNLNSFLRCLLKGQLRTAWNEFNLSFNKEIKRKKLIFELRKKINTYSYETAEMVGNYGGMWGIKEFWPKSWFSGFVLKEFEGLSVRVPAMYNEILVQVYGDYMKLPPLEKRISHHNLAFINIEKRVSMDQIRIYMNNQNS
ncbi:LicD family protein [Sphingobacterium composti Ten et al. 2007 non Yoo et al. 2007]|uniref:LicD family protein n=1 Tax=Sphingobacterium composti TaxID=363260 RepID=UPI00135A06D3|nr:LicD family protein [Sphingobacterium composti Ten et al. 2007 non Yoo et al. 2007]